MRTYIIKGGVVVNTVEAESLEMLPDMISAETGGGIGDLWDGQKFTTPATPAYVPISVSMRQARLALLAAGLLDAVNSAIAAMPGAEGDAARIEWEFAQDVRLDSLLVVGLAGALGLSDARLADLFMAASAL